MGIYDAPGLNRQRPMAHSYGNVSKAYQQVTIPIGGAAAETVDFLNLPRGARILDAQIVKDGLAGTALTLALGLAASPGGATTFVGTANLIAATGLNAAAVVRKDAATLFSGPLDDKYIVRGTLAGVTSTVATVVEVQVEYEFQGTP